MVQKDPKTQIILFLYSWMPVIDLCHRLSNVNFRSDIVYGLVVGAALKTGSSRVVRGSV